MSLRVELSESGVVLCLRVNRVDRVDIESHEGEREIERDVSCAREKREKESGEW